MTLSCAKKGVRRERNVKERAHLCSRLDDTFCDLGFAANADAMVFGDRFHEFILGHGFGIVIDMIAMSLERGYSILANIFEQQEAQAVVTDGMEDFGDLLWD